MASFSRPEDPGLKPRDKLIPWYFVAFFAVIFAVNGVLVYFSVTTMPGVTNKKAYETGLRYNQTLEKAEAAKALGWQLVLEPCVSQNCTIEVVLKDKQEQAVPNTPVKIEAVRQTRAGLDFSRAAQTNAQGKAVFQLPFPAVGDWQVFITATSPTGLHYTQQYEWGLKP